MEQCPGDLSFAEMGCAKPSKKEKLRGHIRLFIFSFFSFFDRRTIACVLPMNGEAFALSTSPFLFTIVFFSPLDPATTHTHPRFFPGGVALPFFAVLLFYSILVCFCVLLGAGGFFLFDGGNCLSMLSVYPPLKQEIAQNWRYRCTRGFLHLC